MSRRRLYFAGGVAGWRRVWFRAMEVAEILERTDAAGGRARETRYVPLPDAAYRWHGVLWACLLPQAILGLLNWRMLSLVWGDMSALQRQNGLCIVVMQVALAIGWVVVAALARARRDAGRDLAWPFQLVVALLPIG